MLIEISRFFADLMVTLAKDGAGGAESAAAISTLWQARTNHTGLAGVELDAETLVHGIGAVAIALAGELVAVRRAAGAPDLTHADVWQEIAQALDPERLHDVGSSGGVIDLP